MLSRLWGRITGADKGKQYPEQQGVSLSRVGGYTVIYPAGFYTNAAKDTLFKEVAPGVIMPVTTKRPSDVAQGETAFFHAPTNSRIIARNNGDLELIPAGKTILKGDAEVTGNLEVTGETALGAVVTSNSVNIGGTHAHSGVTTGPGTSGPPV